MREGTSAGECRDSAAAGVGVRDFGSTITSGKSRSSCGKVSMPRCCEEAGRSASVEDQMCGKRVAKMRCSYLRHFGRHDIIQVALRERSFRRRWTSAFNNACVFRWPLQLRHDAVRDPRDHRSISQPSKGRFVICVIQTLRHRRTSDHDEQDQSTSGTHHDGDHRHRVEVSLGLFQRWIYLQDTGGYGGP